MTHSHEYQDNIVRSALCAKCGGGNDYLVHAGLHSYIMVDYSELPSLKAPHKCSELRLGVDLCSRSVLQRTADWGGARGSSIGSSSICSFFSATHVAAVTATPWLTKRKLPERGDCVPVTFCPLSAAVREHVCSKKKKDVLPELVDKTVYICRTNNNDCLPAQIRGEVNPRSGRPAAVRLPSSSLRIRGGSSMCEEQAPHHPTPGPP